MTICEKLKKLPKETLVLICVEIKLTTMTLKSNQTTMALVQLDFVNRKQFSPGLHWMFSYTDYFDIYRGQKEAPVPIEISVKPCNSACNLYLEVKSSLF